MENKEFLMTKEVSMSKKVLQESALWWILLNIPTADLEYQSLMLCKCFYVIKLKVLCLAGEKLGHFCMMWDTN